MLGCNESNIIFLNKELLITHLLEGGDGAPSDIAPRPIPPYPAGAVVDRLTNYTQINTESLEVWIYGQNCTVVVE